MCVSVCVCMNAQHWHAYIAWWSRKSYFHFRKESVLNRVNFSKTCLYETDGRSVGVQDTDVAHDWLDWRPVFQEKVMVSYSGIERSMKNGLLHLLHGLLDPRRWDHHATSKHWAPVTQWCRGTSQRNRDVNCITARAWKLERGHVCQHTRISSFILI